MHAGSRLALLAALAMTAATAAGAEHSGKAWRLRVDQPLRFLIGR